MEPINSVQKITSKRSPIAEGTYKHTQSVTERHNQTHKDTDVRIQRHTDASFPIMPCLTCCHSLSSSSSAIRRSRVDVRATAIDQWRHVAVVSSGGVGVGSRLSLALNLDWRLFVYDALSASLWNRVSLSLALYVSLSVCLFLSTHIIYTYTYALTNTRTHTYTGIYTFSCIFLSALAVRPSVCHSFFISCGSAWHVCHVCPRDNVSNSVVQMLCGWIGCPVANC